MPDENTIEQIKRRQETSAALRAQIIPPNRTDAVQAVEDWSYELGALKLKLTVSPCSWMYPGYGFQAEYRSEDLRSIGFIHSRDLPVEMATPDDAIRLLNQLAVEPCEKCSAPHIFNPDGNREHQCEVCFIARLNLEIDALGKAEEEAQGERDRARKDEGYTHRVSAWVHPKGGGDDFKLEIYYGRAPRVRNIKDILRRRGSRVLTDYEIVIL